MRIPKNVRKCIKRFPKEDRERVIETLRDFVIDPWRGDIAKIGEKDNLWRRRIGNYRISYSIFINLNVVEIKDIKRRTSNTY
ncbi:MAG: type II toxin-antitoxin system mRNA interferase toxin, RelE/StbE family [Candidatus Sungbacteria bacterium]|nr:type II toxin-antitoxin system mRNA interferase toxin, RelE/StbE family [Candidatus Sungbacteria bacterium]